MSDKSVDKICGYLSEENLCLLFAIEGINPPCDCDGDGVKCRKSMGRCKRLVQIVQGEALSVKLQEMLKKELSKPYVSDGYKLGWHDAIAELKVWLQYYDETHPMEW